MRGTGHGLHLSLDVLIHAAGVGWQVDWSGRGIGVGYGVGAFLSGRHGRRKGQSVHKKDSSCCKFEILVVNGWLLVFINGAAWSGVMFSKRLASSLFGH